MFNRLVLFKSWLIQRFFQSCLAAFLISLSYELIQAQTIPVTDLNVQEQVRMKQLDGEIDFEL